MCGGSPNPQSAIRNPKSLLDSGRCRGRTRRCRCQCERHRRPTRSSPGNPLADAVREAVIEIRLEAQCSRSHVPGAILELSETTPRVEEEGGCRISSSRCRGAFVYCNIAPESPRPEIFLG